MEVNEYSTEKGCDNTTLLLRLRSIIDRDFDPNISKKTPSDYKKCVGQGSLGLNSEKCKKSFNDGIRNHYDVLLNRTRAMLQECIVNDEGYRLSFSKRVIYLLSKSSPLNSEIFYYENKKLSKVEFLSLKEFNFPMFVLAVWHVLITKVQNNTLGKEAFDEYFYYDNSEVEYFFNEDFEKELPTNVRLTEALSPEDPIVFDDFEEIKKEPQPKEEETQEYTEVIDSPVQKQKEEKTITN